MKTILFLTLTCIISSHTIGQLNIDSLYTALKNTFPTGNKEKGVSRHKIFTNPSENTTYDFTLDTKGKIAEDSWGICLKINKLDSIGRQIELRTYNREGNLFAPDSPPIVKTTYRDLEHLEQSDYYNANLSFATRIEVIYDSIGREIALMGYNKDLKIETKQTTEYLDHENAWLKKFYDSNSELVVNDCGVSIWYTRTNKPNGFEVERRYFDKNSMLVDCTHEDPELIYAYNVATQIGSSNEWKMIYYTKKGKIVREFVFKTEE